MSVITYIIDDDPAILEALESLFGLHEFPVRTFSSAEEFLKGLPYPRPACVLVDERLGGMQGRELLEHLSRAGFDVPTILFSAFADTTLAVSAMKQGALTVLDKPLNETALFHAVREAEATEIETLKRNEKKENLRKRFEKLTEGEQQVMKRVVNGDANKAIAFDLKVSLRTVELRRHNVFKKLEVAGIAELVQLSLEMQELELDKDESSPSLIQKD